MVIKEINIIGYKNNIIRGYRYLPDRYYGKIPVVIMSHGFTVNMFTDADIVEPLTRKGFSVVIFDYPGGSLHSRSDGDFKEMSVMTEVQDLKAVVSAIKTLPEYDSYYLLGVSQGGLVAAITAAEVPDIRGLVLYYPGFVIPQYARQMYKSKDDIPEYPEALELQVGRQYYADVYDMDAFKYAEKYDGPVLILHGTADPLVPVQDSIKVKDIYKNCELILYEGQVHGFEGKYREKCIEDVIKFLTKVQSETI